MLIIVCRVLIVYLIVLFYLRVMGKRQLGELQPFELVITLLIADIVALPMTQTSMPILFGLIPLTALVIAHFFVSLIARKSITMRRVLNGKPVLVITPDGIQYEVLSELNMSVDDLMEGIRSCDYYKVEDIQYAIVETNGSINVIPKSSSAGVTNQDLKLTVPEPSLPIILVNAKQIVGENIKLAKITPNFVDNLIKKAGFEKVKDILILTLDAQGNVFVQPIQGESVSFTANFKGDW